MFGIIEKLKLYKNMFVELLGAVALLCWVVSKDTTNRKYQKRLEEHYRNLIYYKNNLGWENHP